MHIKTDTTSLKQALNAIAENFKDADTKKDFVIHLFQENGSMRMAGQSPSEGFWVWSTIPDATILEWTKPVAVNGKALREELKPYRKKVVVDVEVLTETDMDISSDDGDVMFIPLMDAYLAAMPAMEEIAVVPNTALVRMLEQLNTLPITTFHAMSKVIALQTGHDTLHGYATNLCQLSRTTISAVTVAQAQHELLIPVAMVTKLLKVLGRMKGGTVALSQTESLLSIAGDTAGILFSQAEPVSGFSAETLQELVAVEGNIPVGTVNLEQWDAIIVEQKKKYKRASDEKEDKDTLFELDRVYIAADAYTLSTEPVLNGFALPLKELANVMKRVQEPLQVRIHSDRMVLLTREEGYENTTLFPLL